MRRIRMTVKATRSRTSDDRPEAPVPAARREAHVRCLAMASELVDRIDEVLDTNAAW